MDQLVGEIRAALEGRAWTLALQGTLACMDICAALASDDGRTSSSHFKSWFEEHLSGSYDSLSADDVWMIRCGMLHQGRTSGTQYGAILFTLPDGRGNVLHNNILNDALNLDLSCFCTDVLDAAQAWWDASKDTEPVATNATHLVQVRREGLAPYIGGVPVLA